MTDMLALSSHLPELSLAPGAVLAREGDSPGGLWVLVSGALDISKGGVHVNSVTGPGALIGEISALLATPYSATVRASVPCVLRHAVDGPALLVSDPAITRLVAVGLAERLHASTTTSTEGATRTTPSS